MSLGPKPDVSTRDWARGLIRFFGIANWFYGLTGTYLLVDGVKRHAHHQIFGERLYDRPAYYCLVSVNVSFLITILLAGYWLTRIQRRGAIVSNYLFSLEILYFLASGWGALALAMSSNAAIASIGMSFGAVAGTGNMGTSLQFLTAYPLIALAALNIARRRLDRNHSWRHLEPSQSSVRELS